MAINAPEAELTDTTIRDAMLRAEKAVCPPGDARCYGFSNGVTEARTSCRPDGWCRIGWVVANTGRKSWDAWFNPETGEGRLKKTADR